MRLYELKKYDKFKCPEHNSEEEFTFMKVDGMYSICLDSNQETVHIAAFTEVEIVEKENEVQ